MLKRIFCHAFILYCLLCTSCSCNKITDLPEGEPPSKVFPPTGDGPCKYTTINKDSLFPSYMSDVNNLTLRIPSTNTSPPFATIIIEPGFFSLSTDLENIADRYASHGFLVIGVTNTSHFNLITTSIEPYQLALQQVIRYTIECNQDNKSPLFKLIDTTAIGISGHSMGGGGTVMACEAVQDGSHSYIKTAIAMNPFGKCSVSNINMPILFIASDLDSVFNPFMPGVSSSSSDVFNIFQSVPESTTKLFANFKGMDHNAIVDKNIFLNTSGNAAFFLPTMVSWFKVYLAGDTTFNKYLDTTSAEFSTLKTRFTPKGNIPAYSYKKRM